MKRTYFLCLLGLLFTACGEKISAPVSPSLSITQEHDEVFTKIILRATLHNSSDSIVYVWKTTDSLLTTDSNYIEVAFAEPGTYPISCQAKSKLGNIIIAECSFDILVKSKNSGASLLLITPQKKADLFSPIEIKAVVSNFSAPVTYHWTTPLREIITDSATISLTFVQPGSVSLYCSVFDQQTQLLVARDSIAVEVSKPNVQLDWVSLLTLNAVDIQVHAQMTASNQSGSSVWHQATTTYRIGPKKIQKWTDSGSYNLSKYDTTIDYRRTNLFSELRTIIDPKNSIMKSLIYTVRNDISDYYANRFQSEEESILSSNLFLIKQTADSAIFACFGKRCFSLTSWDRTQGSGPDSESWIHDIKWDVDPEKQSCIVVFSRQ